MKRIAIITCATALFFSASVNAQNDSTRVDNRTVSQWKDNGDKWNNNDPAKYQLREMPEPLTIEKIYPVIGTYNVTSKDGQASNLTVTLDEQNKGIAWIDGLPEGRIKAQLRKSPGTYKIPEQKIGEEGNQKTVHEGVLIYDKDANTMNVCLGCKYNMEDPGAAFLPAPAEEEKVAEEMPAKNKKASAKTKTTKAKEETVKPVFYSGTKNITEAQQQAATPSM